VEAKVFTIPFIFKTRLFMKREPGYYWIKTYLNVWKIAFLNTAGVWTLSAEELESREDNILAFAAQNK